MPWFTTHRPRTFEEVIGHDALVIALRATLAKKDRPHTLLFTGPSGVGKTTLARIVADTVGARPSGIQEINIAHFRGIDQIRDMVSRFAYVAPGSPVSVYILDEVHQMTNDAQNVLLKELEEPHDHVYFVLCTTDPGSLISTLRTRCHEYRLEPLDDEQIKLLLDGVCDAEGVERFEDQWLDLILESAAGSPRVALNIAERIEPAETIEAARRVALALVEADVAAVGDNVALDLVRAIETMASGKAWERVVEICEERLTRRATPVDIARVKRGMIALLAYRLIKHDSAWAGGLILDIEATLLSANTYGGLLALLQRLTRTHIEEARGGKVRPSKAREIR